MTVIRLGRFQPPSGYGPLIDIVVERITAVEQKYFNAGAHHYAIVHLIGGEVITVMETMDQVWERISDTSTRVYHGVQKK